MNGRASAVNIEPVDLLIRVALATEGAQESPAGSNAGPFVERCQRVTGNKPPDAWCASWLAMVGHDALGKLWPLPPTASCQELADFAKAQDVFEDVPALGDVFLVWHAKLGRFAHAGLILDAVTRPAITLSGNTTLPGGTGDPREGWVVARKPWTFRPEDRFVRWPSLL